MKARFEYQNGLFRTKSMLLYAKAFRSVLSAFSPPAYSFTIFFTLVFMPCLTVK